MTLDRVRPSRGRARHGHHVRQRGHAGVDHCFADAALRQRFDREGGGRAAAAVDRVDRSRRRFVDEREAVAARARAGGLDDRQRSGRCDRGVGGVAARAQHLQPGLGRERVAGRHHSFVVSTGERRERNGRLSACGTRGLRSTNAAQAWHTLLSEP